MARFTLAKLANRKLLKITGPDCYPYLQGLLCNDLRYLYEPDRIPKRKHARNSPSIMGAFMLNPHGRVICDMLLYRTPMTKYQCEFTPPGQAKEHDELLIECDSSVASGLANTLYGYRVRRKIAIAIQDKHLVWSLFPASSDHEQVTMLTTNDDRQLALDKEVVSEALTVVGDPRLDAMGLRIITTSGDFDSVKKTIQSVVDMDIEEATANDYITHRYNLGVGEGLKDHPESACLPLECNADYLGLVSFNKGCYLGQELTARIHYTGVVRKRIMPVILEDKPSDPEPGVVPLIDGSDIVDEVTGKKLGILRNYVKKRGIALLRHDLLTESTQMVHLGTKTRITTYKPFWWNEN